MLASVFEAHNDHWGTTNELLATLIELVDRGDRWFFMANSEKDATPPDPIVIPRPGERSAADGTEDSERTEPDPEPTRRPATAAEMKAFFGGAVQYDPGG